MVPELSWAFDFQALQAEAIGWLPLGDGAYLHPVPPGPPDEEVVILVVGIPEVEMAGLNVLLLV